MIRIVGRRRRLQRIATKLESPGEGLCPSRAPPPVRLGGDSLANLAITIAAEDAGTRDARWCFARYYEELDERFEAGFDPERSNAADALELTPPAGVLLVARLRGGPAGCGALKLRPGGVVELKRMWVAPHVRGLGLGRRLLVELEAHAARSGVRTVRLETNRTLGEAIALYRQAGYREVAAFNDEPYAHHWFEKRLTGQLPDQQTRKAP